MSAACSTPSSSNPAQYGLTNVNTPCFSGAIDRPGTVCANPDEYLFWDSVHPTAAAHQIFGDFALAALAGWDEADSRSGRSDGDPLQVAGTGDAGDASRRVARPWPDAAPAGLKSQACLASMTPRRIARVRVNSSSSLSPSPQRMAR